MFIYTTPLSSEITPFYNNSEKISVGSKSLLDIFPINKGPLSTTLKKYLSFIVLAQEALGKFENRIMPFFDPIVGENACQVRAAMFAEILEKDGIDEHILLTRKQLVAHTEKIKELINHLDDKSICDSFKSFLEQNDAILEISEDISIIISSFILSETKVVEYKPNDFGVPLIKERIPFKNFSLKKGIAPTFASAIIKLAQAKLSDISVSYIQRLALLPPFSKEERDAAMLVFGNFVKLDERHRKITPFFPTVHLILKRLHKSKVPLILKVKQYVIEQSQPYGSVTLVFGNQGKDDYCYISNPPEKFKKGAVFINTKSITEKPQSSEELQEKILKHSIKDLILSAAADHPAYGCDDKDRPEDPLCERYRRLAHEWGTCRSNPSLFIVEHICCDLVNIDSKGDIVENVYISSKQKVIDFYDAISDLGSYVRPRLKLVGGGKVIPEATIKDKKTIDLTMADSRLNNATVLALEYSYTPHHRKFPVKKYKVKITD